MKLADLFHRTRQNVAPVANTQPKLDPEPVPRQTGPIYSIGRRERMLGGLDLGACTGIEIGPLHNPLVLKDQGQVLYADHCDTETLRDIWSKDSTVDTTRLHVDIVWRNNSLRDALAATSPELLSRGGIDYVVASHVVEHVPDLIGWLNQIHDVLKSNGQLRLAVPDRRFTFDYLRQTTTLADVLSAHLAKAKVPSPSCILDHTLNMVTVDCATAWRGELDVSAMKPIYSFDYCVATAEDARTKGTYHDFHCWVFTPSSFLRLCIAMAQQNLLGFSCEKFYDTAHNEFEFTLHLKKCDHGRQLIDSWTEALAAAKHYAFAPE